MMSMKGGMFGNSSKISYNDNSISNSLREEDGMKHEIDMILKFVKTNNHEKLYHMFQIIDAERYREYIKNVKGKLDELYSIMEEKIEANEMDCVDEYHKFILKNCGKSTYKFVKFCKRNKVDYNRYIKE